MTDEPKKPRRRRVDSQQGVAAAMLAGGKKIAIPDDAPLSGYEREIFSELANEFSRSELTAHKVRLLTILAKQVVLLEQEQVLLAQEGFSLLNANGNTIPNPRARACSSMSATILAMRRSLGIHTRAQAGGDNREAAKRRAINKASEAERSSYDDNLIVFPNSQGMDDDGE